MLARESKTADRARTPLPKGTPAPTMELHSYGMIRFKTSRYCSSRWFRRS